jgi:aldehyde:ferredoxin oxidoreductase
VHKIAGIFWGSEEAGDFTSYEGKALAAKIIQNRTYLKEMLGLCDWAYPITYSLNTPDHMGDPDIEGKLCNAVTGIAGEDLEQYAERVYNLQRMILLREGRKVPEADYPMEYNFTEPLRSVSIIGIMVPGPGDSTVDMTGNKLDRDKFTKMLREYYALRGWDEETGQPRAETLAAFGVADLIPS